MNICLIRSPHIKRTAAQEWNHSLSFGLTQKLSHFKCCYDSNNLSCIQFCGLLCGTVNCKTLIEFLPSTWEQSLKCQRYFFQTLFYFFIDNSVAIQNQYSPLFKKKSRPQLSALIIPLSFQYFGGICKSSKSFFKTQIPNSGISMSDRLDVFSCLLRFHRTEFPVAPVCFVCSFFLSVNR